MNERINEIAFESGCNRAKYSNPQHPDLEGWIINQEALYKFAELIVSECANKAFAGYGPDSLDEYDRGWQAGRNNAAKVIKEYFELKEN